MIPRVVEYPTGELEYEASRGHRNRPTAVGAQTAFIRDGGKQLLFRGKYYILTALTLYAPVTLSALLKFNSEGAVEGFSCT